VEPYGLVFLTGHWYLVAHDPARQRLRQFRLSRVSRARCEHTRKQPDYVIPDDFDLERHAASRQSWELGDEDAVMVVVAFQGTSGQVQQGMQLGQPAPEDGQRLFSVRRRDPFLRWLLTFGGDATVVAPVEWCEQWRALVQATLTAQRAVPVRQEVA
jgi:predicted DNA-binding transcriptional regulator YafY